MKKVINGFLCVLLLCSCGSTGGSVSTAGMLSLDAAIQRTAEEINAALPEGRRVAVMSFTSESPELSAYIMEELTGRLAQGRKLVMLDRRNIAYIEKELNFQASGAVSDESAQSIGMMLGAESIAVGSLTKKGSGYSWRVSVLWVESAVVEIPVILEVRDGREFTTPTSAAKAANTSARETALTRAPQTATDYLNRGLIFAMRRDFDLAYEDFTEAIKLDPSMTLAYLQRGKTFLARQIKITKIGEGFELSWSVGARNKTADDDRALADFAKAISLAPNLTAAWNYRGDLYLEIKEYDKAIADYNQAIRSDPNYADAYNNRGIAYAHKGDYGRAIADYNQVIKLNSNYTAAYYNRGIAYDNKGDYDRAIADYNQAIRLNPNYAVAYYNRGNAYYMKADYQRAIADYTQALKLDPNDADAKKWLEEARKRAR